MTSYDSVRNLLPCILVVTGLLGLVASFELTLQSIVALKDSAYIPPCNISPFISCSSIMSSWQSTLFGFPNSLLGIVGFPIVVTMGVTILAGAQFKRWFWIGAQVGVTGAVAFVYWFFYQSAFVINSLCPWCMVFWTATIPLFWYVTLYNVMEEHVRLPKYLSKVKPLLMNNPHLPLLVLYGVILVTILVRFWSYWGALL